MMKAPTSSTNAWGAFRTDRRTDGVRSRFESGRPLATLRRLPTNAAGFYYQADVEQEEEFWYVGLHESFYPWMNKYGKYPIGHPMFLYEPGTTDL